MPQTPRVFISYARKDGENFAADLMVRIEKAHIPVWRDRDGLRGGEGWWSQIDYVLDQVEFMVVVMTPGATTSEVVGKEWDAARRKGVCIFPVIASDALDWDAMPIWMQKGHLYDLEHQAQKFINDLNTRCRQTRVPFMAEDLPANYVLRAELFDELMGMLIDGERGMPKAITAALRGAGGFGKTVMAQALCHTQRTRDVFYDGILWVTLGEDPGNLTLKVQGLIDELTRHWPNRRTFTETTVASNHLRELLEEKSVLIVVDDVWNEADARPFLVGGPGCAWLLTTRNRDTLPILSEEINVDEMGAEEAVCLLGAGLSFEEERAGLTSLTARLGEWPLLLNLVNRVLVDQVKLGRPLQHAVTYANTKLDRQGLMAFDRRQAKERDQAVTKTINVSLELLRPEEQARLEELAVFPEDLAISVTTVARLWLETGGLDEFVTKELCLLLFDLSLLSAYDFGAQTIRLHDVVRAYLRGRISMDRLRELNGTLIDAHGYTNPAAMPPEEPYLWRHLVLHLADAGRTEALRDLLMRFEWIQAKFAATDILALIDDYQHLDDEADARAVVQTLRLSAHVLSTDEDQLAGQLYGRLLLLESERVQALVASIPEARSEPWMRPLNPALTPPGGSELQTLAGHQGWVRTVAITPDGARAVSASKDGTLKVWDLATGAEQRTLSVHQDDVKAVAITSDGTRAVLASTHGLKVWDLATGVEQQTLSGHQDDVNAVAITPDGTRAVSASKDGTLKVWNLATGAEQRTLSGHQSLVRAVAITPDGTRAVSASEDGTLKVWDLATGVEQQTLSGHQDDVKVVAITPDGTRAVSASKGGTLKVWDLATGAEQRTLSGHQDDVKAVAITPDGTRAVSASYDRTLKVWDLVTGAEQRTLSGHQDDVNAVAITPDGTRAVSASYDRTLKVWDLVTGAEQRTLSGHQSLVRAVAITPDGTRAVSSSDDRPLKVWDLATGAEQRTLSGHQSLVRGVAITPDGTRAVSASEDGTLKVWDLATGAEQRTLSGHRDSVRTVTITPDGTRVVSASEDGTLKVWDLATGAEQRTLSGHRDSVRTVTITPDGTRVVSVHQSWVKAVELTPDGTRVHSASFHQTLKVWDLATGAEQRTLSVHQDDVRAVALTSDGARAVLASEDGTLKVWDLATGAEQRTLSVHQDDVRAVALTSDGARAVLASEDGMLKMWELTTGRLICTFTCEGAVYSLAIVPDGHTFVAGDVLGRVYFLRLENG